MVALFLGINENTDLARSIKNLLDIDQRPLSEWFILSAKHGVG
jgi:hypothetical protein